MDKQFRSTNHVKVCLTGLTALAVLLLLNVKTHAQDADSEVAKGSEMREKLARIGKFEPGEGAELVEEVSVELRKTQALLLFRLDEPDPQTKCYAAYCLGLYRFENAVPELANNLLLEDTTHQRVRSLWVWGEHPVTEALIKIGKKSVPAMIDKLATSKNPKEREQALLVIRGVEGPQVGRFVLELARNQEKNAQKKARLQAALKQFVAQKN